MSKTSSIKTKLLIVCNLVNKINSEGPVKTNSVIAKEVINNLGLIVEELADFMGSNYHHKLKYLASKGGGMFPSIPWVAITLENTKPSKDKSIAICFDKNGKGFVAGVLLPTGKDANYPAIYRGKIPKLNVDGQSEFTKYNDRFINPVEFLMADFSEVDFLNHLLNSMKIFENTFIE
jgi:hypothetical protein